MVKCPGCGASLAATGEVEVSGERFGVYQCDTCVVPWDFNGATFDTALTFALDSDGRIIETESFQPLDPPRIRRDASKSE